MVRGLIPFIIGIGLGILGGAVLHVIVTILKACL